MNSDLKSSLYKPSQLPMLDNQYKELFEQYNTQSKKLYPCCICYFVDSKVIAPLLSVEYDVNVHSSLAVVEIRQVYETTLDKPAQIEYLFSINPNASFTKLEVLIGDITMYGVIKEKELASQEYDYGISDGKTMVYSEKDDQFPDIMRVKLGNIEPGQKLEIHFQYIQQLQVCVNEFWRLEIDPVVHPRYRLSKNDNKFMKNLKSIIDFNTYQSNHKQSIKVKIETVSAINFCKSPTHTIIIDQSVKQNQIIIDLDPDIQDNFRSDKAFVLMFADEDIHKPQLYLTHTNNDALSYQKYCATLTLIPKFNPLQLDDAYQAYSDIDSNDFTYQQKGIYLFVLDRSGSMNGIRIKKAKEALILFIQSLPEDSYFNVISFGSNFELMFDSPQKYSQEVVTIAIYQISNMEGNLGGTEILKPLQQCFTKVMEEYPQNVFILTDGEVQPDEVIEYVRSQHNASIRVYTLGIGNGCSKYLIEKLAYIGNGSFHFVADDDEDLNAKVIDLLQDSITPYLENIQFTNSITYFNSVTPNPESIICVKKNTPITIQLVFPPSESIEDITIGFEAFDPQTKQKLGYTNTIKLSDSKEMDYFHKLAAYRQITIIEDEVKYQEPTLRRLTIKKDKIELEDIIQISVQNQVLSKTTAFICEVKDIADQFKQQYKVIQYQKILQPRTINDKYSYALYRNPGAIIQNRSNGMFGFIKNNSPPISPYISAELSIKAQMMKQFQTSSSVIDYGQVQQFVEDKSHDQPSSAYEVQPDQYEPQKQQQQILVYTKILKYVCIDGSFDVKLLNLSKINVPDTLDLQIWITIIALSYLEFYCQEDRAAWQLVFKKGVAYLLKKGVKYSEYKQEALALIQNLYI